MFDAKVVMSAMVRRVRISKILVDDRSHLGAAEYLWMAKSIVSLDLGPKGNVYS